MTDDEIIRTIDRCAHDTHSCDDCICNPRRAIYGYCMRGLIGLAADLLQRQKAENEKLQNVISNIRIEVSKNIEEQIINDFLKGWGK